MKSIPLTQGKTALVDDGDYEWLSRFNWHYNGEYATRQSKGLFRKQQTVYMHREILNPPSNMFTDHIDGNRLNNQRSNLRVCDKQNNKANSKVPVNNTSGYKGVSWRENRGCWEARIIVNGKSMYFSGFDNPEDAAKAYNEAAIKYFGDFARLNEIP